MFITNSNNTICLIDSKIKKIGPTAFMKGEIYFYENIPKESAISRYFPKYYGSIIGEEESQLYIEYIEGRSLYTLFKNEELTEYHIKQIFMFMDELHNLSGTIPTDENIYANYINKLKARFLNKEAYPFPDAYDIQERCLENIRDYKPSGTAYIHGDLWFSNIIIDIDSLM